MRLLDRPQPAVCALGFAALLSACGPSTVERARLDKLEQRMSVLEKQVATASPGPPGKAAAPPPAAPIDVSHYQEGAVATVRPAPTDSRTLAEIPSDSVGGFIYTGGPIALHDLASGGVLHTGLTGVALEGWLKALKSGRYEFGEDLHGSLGPGSITGAPCLL